MSNQLQHKLQNFEATPPKQTWAAIEERLLHDQTNLQDRLLQYEATPPSQVWNTIEAALTASIKKETPFTQRSWFKYAVAATILGVIAIGIFTLIANQPEKDLAQQASPSLEQTNTQTTTAPATLPSQQGVTIKNEPVNDVSQVTVSKQSASASAKRYKVVTQEDGKLVRLSQKAYAVFDCAVKATAQKSARCKENIQTMQEKMATAVISPSTDFAGLIDMIKTLEENK